MSGLYYNVIPLGNNAIYDDVCVHACGNADVTEDKIVLQVLTKCWEQGRERDECPDLILPFLVNPKLAIK